MVKGIMNISLPVTVFEPKSFLERVADQFCFLPSFIQKLKYIRNQSIQHFHRHYGITSLLYLFRCSSFHRAI